MIKTLQGQRKKMKLRESRKCVWKPPPAPSRKRKGILKLRMPRPLLRVNILQRQRYHSMVEVKIEDCATVGDLKESITVQKNLSVVALLYREFIHYQDHVKAFRKLCEDNSISGLPLLRLLGFQVQPYQRRFGASVLAFGS